ncbi:hypothetical protein ACTQ6A_16295 [Lachnospiraceae bacterium LCP25S3_G4]
MRATFASALVEHIDEFPLSKSEAYMMGMFSTLEYMIEAPLEELLQDIPIIDEVKNALIDKSGDAGKLYQMMLDYEQANWKEIRELMAYFELPSSMIAQLYINCIEEVNQVWEGLTSSYEVVE